MQRMTEKQGIICNKTRSSASTLFTLMVLGGLLRRCRALQWLLRLRVRIHLIWRLLSVWTLWWVIALVWHLTARILWHALHAGLSLPSILSTNLPTGWCVADWWKLADTLAVPTCRRMLLRCAISRACVSGLWVL